MTFTATNSGDWQGVGSGYIWERSSTDHWFPTAGDTVNMPGVYGAVYLSNSVTIAVLNRYWGVEEGTLELRNGCTLAVDGSGDWSGGRIGGGGCVFLNTGILTNSGSNSKIPIGAMINSNRVVHNGSGALGIFAGSDFYNGAGAVYDFQTDADINWGAGGGGWPEFHNLPGSIFRKSGGTGTTEVSIVFNSQGALIEIQTGTFHIGYEGVSSDTTYSVSSGAILNNTPEYANTYAWAGRQSGSGNGQIILTNKNIDLSGTPVALSFPSNLFRWSGGNINGGVLNNEGVIHLDGAATKNLKGTLNNSNRIEQSGTGGFDIYWLGGSVNNAAGAVYNIQGDGGITDDAGDFNNYGTLRKSAGAGTATVGCDFNNAGSIEVSSGTLCISGAGNRTGTTYTVAGGAVLDLSRRSGTSWAYYYGVQSATGGGQVLVTNQGFYIADAGGAFNFPTNCFQWSGGYLTGGGLTNLGVIHLVGPNEKKVSNFENRGQVLQQGDGNFAIHQDSVMRNCSGAVFEIKTDADFTEQVLMPSFYNDPSGMVRKVLGTGTSSVRAAFYNSGIVDIRSGTLDFPQIVSFGYSYTQTAGVTRLWGGNMSAADGINIQGGTLTGTGMLSGDVVNNGIIAPGNTTGTLYGIDGLDLGASSELQFSLGGPAAGLEYDQVHITNWVEFGGALTVSTTNGYDPVGHTYTLMTYGWIFSGRFASTNLPPLTGHPDLHWMVNYGSNALVITPAGYYSFTSGTFTGLEASGIATVRVTRNTVDAGDLILRYATWDGTAKEGMDYTAVTGTVSLVGTQRTNTFTVPLVNNAYDVLSNRAFYVSIGPDGDYPYEPSGAATAAVVIVDDDAPVAAALPFAEDFESGVFSNYWTLFGSTEWGGLAITTNYEPHGQRHVLMDSTVGGSNALEEMILTVNLAGRTNVWLTFYHKDISDEHEVMPDTFTQHTNADGAAISPNGTNWYAVQQFSDWDDTSSEHEQFAVSLDAQRAKYGLAYNAAFKIKFQHYDNWPAPDDGFGFDDIRVYIPVGMLKFVSNEFRVGEAAGTATIMVARVGANTAAVSCTYTMDAHSLWTDHDYSGGTGVLNFAYGQTAQTFTVALLDDTDPEADESGRILLEDFVGCAPSNGVTTLTLADNEATNITKAFFETGLPAGWAVRTNGIAAGYWRFDKPGSWSNYSGGYDDYATADSYDAGAGAVDTELRTPVFDFTDWLSVFFQYRAYFFHWSGEVGDIDVSTNGAAGPWVTFCRYSDDAPWVFQTWIMSSWVAGRSNVMFRLHYYTPSQGYWWQIDEVQIYGELDSDHDGMPNWWESAASGGNATSINPWADDDSDRFENYFEYRANTGVGNSNSYLGIESIMGRGTSSVVRWQSATGKTYRLERCPNPRATNWSWVSTNIAANPPSNVETDKTVSGSGLWIYRIGLEP